MKPIDGGPAFPRPCSEDRTSGSQADGDTTVQQQTGMSLRDYFAGQMIAGIAGMRIQSGELAQIPGGDVVGHYARAAYAFADAMIAARKGGAA